MGGAQRRGVIVLGRTSLIRRALEEFHAEIRRDLDRILRRVARRELERLLGGRRRHSRARRSRSSTRRSTS